MSTQQPLGYLIKSLDNALHRYVDGVLRENHGVSRGHWQALRTAQNDPDLTREKFTEEAGAFYTPDDIEKLLLSLTDNGWLLLVPVATGATGMRITAAGRELLEQMSRTQARTAEIVSDGVPPEDYETVLRTLATMLDNLEAATPRSGEKATAP
ncbi:hypothetical protein ACL02S_13045 [Nocardia sp. 004]|uniref:hypothetical protein n=1 Tax=Nocardia sp. 004 TaxID=3385978 RepID=UPI0039A39B7E